jgi:hypothetical protein
VSQLALVALLASCGGDTTAPESTTSTTLPAPTTTHVETTTSTTATTMTEATTTTVAPTTNTAPLIDQSVAAFQEWVGALAEGEVERAWDLMAPSSQEALGSFEQFYEMRTGLAEGWGSWVAVEDPTYTLMDDEAGRTLMVANGTIRPEGERRDP